MKIPESGDVLLDKYRLDEVIGEGGFGVVFLGTTLASGRQVAVKVLKPGSEGYDMRRAARFLRELRTIAKLQSPHTLTMYDYGRTPDGLMLMVTEYIEGEDLDELLKRSGTLGEFEVVHILLQTLESLREAHDIGVLHRDIKPANIRVFRYAGDPLRVKVLDFGLAKSLSAGETRLTEAGKVVGTPRFMSPEQLRGKDLTPQTDIYSLGLVAVELLLGRREGLARSANRRPELKIVDPVGRELRLIINKMVERRRRKRYASAGDVIAALAPIFRRLKHARPPAPLPPPPEEQSTDELPERETEETRQARPRQTTVEDVVAATHVIAELANAPVIAEQTAVESPRPSRLRSSRRSISMAVERVPRWVWVAATLVAIALLGSAIHFYQAYTAEQLPAPRRVVQRAASTVHVGSPGCGSPVPHRGPGLLAAGKQSLRVVIPGGYDPYGDRPLLMVFVGSDRESALVDSELLAELSSKEEVLIAVVDHTNPPAPTLAGLSNRLCVDMRNVFAIGVGDGASELMDVRCALPFAAISFFEPTEGPEASCDRAVPTLLMSATVDLDRRTEQREQWTEMYDCEPPARFSREHTEVHRSWKCDKGPLTLIERRGGWDDPSEAHTAAWYHFYRHLQN